MQVTKLGHCCLIIEEGGIRIMTDPGSYTTAEQSDARNIDLILITHEHQDHLHVDSLKIILQNNPNAKIITNSGVGKILTEDHIAYDVVEEGDNANVSGVLIEGFGTKHSVIYEDYGLVHNTGYFINDKLFYPGDAFTIPGKRVDILALPAAGPWMRVSEAIDYAKEVQPRVCFPVHDGMILPSAHFALHLFDVFLNNQGIKFVPIKKGEETEL